MRKLLLTLIVISITLFSMPIVQIAQVRDVSRNAARSGTDVAAFLRDMSTATGIEDEDLYSVEIKKIATVLASPGHRSAMLIDQTGNDRELIANTAAARITA